MLQLRRSGERGHADHGWLKAAHTFSFADYHDERHLGFRALRVMNEDRVAPGTGFGMHPHRDMEIVTVVLSGQLQHRDSLGNTEVLLPGEVQAMSAGTGVVHSEVNPSRQEPVHLYQIWLVPERRGLAPAYAQKAFPAGPGLTLVASRDGAHGSLRVSQDVRVFRGELAPGTELAFPLAPGRHAWVQVLRGALSVKGLDLSPGDGVAVSDEASLALRAGAGAEVLVFDLA